MSNYQESIPTRLHAKPHYNIAFAIDDQDDGLEFTFAGAEEGTVRRLFEMLCAGGMGIADGFTMEWTTPRLFRRETVYDRLEVRLMHWHRHSTTVEVIALMIEQWLRRNVRTHYVDRYAIDDLLNITGHTPELMLNGPKKRKKKGAKAAPAETKTTEQTEEPMANIYLKMPWYVACHFRGREEKRQLTEWEPVKFNDFNHEYRVLLDNCRRIPEQNQSPICYSQRAWQNILRGRKPDGSRLILNRDPETWPDAKETATLTGVKMTPRHHASDYLCIEIPREVYIGDRPYRTNQSYCLDKDAAYFLSAMLSDRFAHEYTQFVEKDIRNAAALGFKRKQMEAVERYFVQYNFPDIIDPQLRESLRRQHTRMMNRGHAKPRYMLQFDEGAEQFLEHVSEADQKRIDENNKHQ